jgi:hypothetical protein
MVDLEKFGRLLRLRWLWLHWKEPGKTWLNSELPVERVHRALFVQATQVQIHNGKTAKFWMDSWLNGVSPATMFSSLYQHSRRKGRTVAEAMANDNWIGDLMRSLTAQLMVEYTLLWELFDASHFDQHD